MCGLFDLCSVCGLFDLCSVCGLFDLCSVCGLFDLCSVCGLLRVPVVDRSEFPSRLIDDRSEVRS